MEAREQQVAELQAQAESWNPEQALRWGLGRFDQTLGIASSFGAEDVVLIDLAARLGKKFRVFTLDTDFLFPETYDLIDRVEIIRGPGSALYGSDAFSGVINIITKGPGEVPGTEIGARTGSYKSRDAWLQHGGKLGPVGNA